MNHSEVYQLLMNSSKILRKVAEEGLDFVFGDEFCLVFQVDGRDVVVGRNGEVFIQEQKKHINWEVRGKKKCLIESKARVPGRESLTPTPNSYGIKWTRGKKQELELTNGLESFFNNLESL